MRYLTLIICCITVAGLGQDNFRIRPYLQNPSPDGMTLIWFSHSNEAGQLFYGKADTTDFTCIYSVPEPAPALAYTEWEDSTFFGGRAPEVPFRHRIRLEGLESATAYSYSLIQGSSAFSGGFRTAPSENAAIRFMVYSDSETEPESTGAHSSWSDTAGMSRNYLMDQTQGYRNNLEVIRSRDPDLVLIAGDLVQCGGEQRDWDEFWQHNAGSEDMAGLASHVPLFPALGNHEYYEGGSGGHYYQPRSEQAVDKYQSYFELPPNHAPNTDQEGRYYSFKYGPASFIVLDVCNNGKNESEYDTNFYLLGESDSAGGNAPDFGPGSRQYAWLEEQLAAFQEDLFTFVVFHHAPYSSGPHGLPPGSDSLEDAQSGHPVRQLTDLFFKYGVDAVFSGHDEMWERSLLEGLEEEPDGTMREYQLPFYDVGTGGDGLRAPWESCDNPYQAFMAHSDAPEIWEDSLLLEGGKHYGHLEVSISPLGDDRWEAILDPVYVLPQKDPGDTVFSSNTRMLYSDRVSLVREVKSPVDSSLRIPFLKLSCEGDLVLSAYPNPFREKVMLKFNIPVAGEIIFRVFDLTGRLVYTEGPLFFPAGIHILPWEGRDGAGNFVPSGVYQGVFEVGTSDGSGYRSRGSSRLIRY